MSPMNRLSFKALFAIVSLIGVQVSQTVQAASKSNSAVEEAMSHIIVHNRPLAKINGKVFSVIDVQKSMNRYLLKAYPDIFQDPQSVLQFYVHNWRPVLQEMIDNELMLMEAEELTYKMDASYIKEEMRERFGENANEISDNNDMSKEELEKIVGDDLICRSLLWYRVWQPAMNEVTPKVIHDHYVANVLNGPAQDSWKYQMCTIRGKDANQNEKIAKELKKVFKKADTKLGGSLTDAVAAVSSLTPEGVSVKVSDDIVLTSQELSKENLSILQGLKPMEISKAVNQKSRYDDQTVTRIFQLKEHTVTAPPAFEDVSSQIKEALIGEKSEGIRQEYMTRLRKRFCCEDLVMEKMYGPETRLFALNGS